MEKEARLYSFQILNKNSNEILADIDKIGMNCKLAQFFKNVSYS